MLRLVSLFSFKKKKILESERHEPRVDKDASCHPKAVVTGSSTELSGLGFRLYLGILLSSAKLKIFGCVAFHVLHHLWGHFLISSRFLISLLHYQGAIVHLLHILVAVRKMSQKALQWAWVYNERTVLVPRFPTFIFLKISTGQLDNRARMTSGREHVVKSSASHKSAVIAHFWLCFGLEIHFLCAAAHSVPSLDFAFHKWVYWSFIIIFVSSEESTKPFVWSHCSHVINNPFSDFGTIPQRVWSRHWREWPFSAENTGVTKLGHVDSGFSCHLHSIQLWNTRLLNSVPH